MRPWPLSLRQDANCAVARFDWIRKSLLMFLWCFQQLEVWTCLFQSEFSFKSARRSALAVHTYCAWTDAAIRHRWFEPLFLSFYGWFTALPFWKAANPGNAKPLTWGTITRPYHESSSKFKDEGKWNIHTCCSAEVANCIVHTALWRWATAKPPP